MVAWVGQLYQSKHNINVGQAAFFISANSAGFFVGRSFLSWVTARWKIADFVLLAICAGGGTLAFAATLCSGSYFWGLFAFSVAGLFISGDSPTINSYTGLRFPGDTPTAFALLGGIGNIGAGTGPYVVGILGDRLGLETGIWLMPVCSLALAILAFGWSLQAKPSPNL
jgi:fucose permease